MDKRMTLEAVRDEISSGEFAPTQQTLDRWADAIDAELKTRGEPVGYVWFTDDGFVRMWSRDAKRINENGAVPVYAAPPAPKITDDMCERAATAFAIANPDWAEPRAHYMQRWRVALEAALKETP